MTAQVVVQIIHRDILVESVSLPAPDVVQVVTIGGPPGSAGIPGADGANGSDGATWFDGSGAPSNGLGVNGDFYLDDDMGDVYKKVSGTYGIVANIKGAPGADGSDGADGAPGAPGAPGADGSTWRDGSGAPSDGLGANGDFYLDDDTGNVYRKAAGAYTLVANIKGAPGADGSDGADGNDGAPGSPGADGAPGSVWRDGSGAPSNGLGVNGDYYLDDDTGDVYHKAAGVYTLVANIKGADGEAGSESSESGTPGADGATWRDGSGAPSDGLGAENDYYLDDDMGDVYKKVSGTYGIVANIKGAPGADGSDGADGAPGAPGAPGADGSDGADGADGRNAGFKYQFNTATSGDPGSGKFLFDGTFLSAAHLNISETDGDANSIAAILAGLDDSTSVNKCLVTARKFNSNAFFSFYITGALTDSGAYNTFPITPVETGGSISNNDTFFLEFEIVGNKGDTGATGSAGSNGSNGSNGADGQDGGFKFQFNTGTSGDPGSGKFLFDNGTFASATHLNISETDANSNAIAAFLATLDDGTSTDKCIVVAMKQGGSAFFSFKITGTITDNGSYDTFAITPLGTSGSISNNDVFHLNFYRVGDKGADGADGAGGALVGDIKVVTECTGIPGVTFTSSGSVTVIGQRAQFTPFYVSAENGIDISGIDFATGATVSSSPTVFIGIYQWGPGNLPTTLLGSVSQAVAANTGYNKSISLHLDPGYYAVCVLFDKTGTQNLIRMTGIMTVGGIKDMQRSTNTFGQPVTWLNGSSGWTALPNPTSGVHLRAYDYNGGSTLGVSLGHFYPCFFHWTET